MSVATLRAVGGSIMVAIPRPVLEALGLAANSKVTLSVADGRLIAEPVHRRRFTLSELVAQCDPAAPASDDESVWPDLEPRGDEAW
ncbi:MAG: AbrB/MazE/SpoVT family DNA-binding domain-containing protein [Pseudomonadota bacterium]